MSAEKSGIQRRGEGGLWRINFSWRHYTSFLNVIVIGHEHARSEDLCYVGLSRQFIGPIVNEAFLHCDRGVIA